MLGRLGGCAAAAAARGRRLTCAPMLQFMGLQAAQAPREQLANQQAQQPWQTDEMHLTQLLIRTREIAPLRLASHHQYTWHALLLQCEPGVHACGKPVDFIIASQRGMCGWCAVRQSGLCLFLFCGALKWSVKLTCPAHQLLRQQAG